MLTHIFYIIFCYIGFAGIVQPVTYLIARRWYEKHPEAEHEPFFEMLENTYGNKKWAVPASICTGAAALGLFVFFVMLSR